MWEIALMKNLRKVEWEWECERIKIKNISGIIAV